MALARGEASHSANYLLQASLQLFVAGLGPVAPMEFLSDSIGTAPASGELLGPLMNRPRRGVGQPLQRAWQSQPDLALASGGAAT